MEKVYKALGLFAICFLCAYAFMLHTAEWTPSSRDPAAVRQIYDFSNLSGDDLQSAIKNRLLKGATVVRENQSLGIQLGHFALASATGEKTMACREFEKVTMRFEADGVAINGDRPVMEIEGPCEISGDINTISPLFIPVDKVLAEKSNDGVMEFNEGQSISLKFHGMPEQWPKRWLLTSVKLSSQTEQKQILVESEEMGHILGRPLMLNFSIHE